MAIAEELRVKALDLSYPVNKDTDILFLGSSVYWAGLDPEVKAYVNKLDPRKVKKIVNFSTAAIKESTYGQMKKLADKNLNRILATKLRQEDFKVSCAFDGQEALKIMESEYIDLIIKLLKEIILLPFHIKEIILFLVILLKALLLKK